MTMHQMTMGRDKMVSLCSISRLSIFSWTERLKLLCSVLQLSQCKLMGKKSIFLASLHHMTCDYTVWPLWNLALFLGALSLIQRLCATHKAFLPESHFSFRYQVADITAASVRRLVSSLYLVSHHKLQPSQDRCSYWDRLIFLWMDLY